MKGKNFTFLAKEKILSLPENMCLWLEKDLSKELEVTGLRIMPVPYQSDRKISKFMGY